MDAVGPARCFTEALAAKAELKALGIKPEAPRAKTNCRRI
jgi:hypothetical protein